MLNSTLKPTIAVILIKGFATDSFAYLYGTTPGIDLINNYLNDTYKDNSNIEYISKTYQWDQKSKVLQDIEDLSLSSQDKLIIIGHSLGGDTSVDVADDLSKTNQSKKNVDLLVQIDSVGYGDDRVLTNVDRRVNYYQEGDNPAFRDVARNIESADADINVETLLKKELTHGEIDDDPLLGGLIKDEIDATIDEDKPKPKYDEEQIEKIKAEKIQYYCFTAETPILMSDGTYLVESFGREKGIEYAVTYFGISQKNTAAILNPDVSSVDVISTNLVNIGASALGSYLGSELYSKLVYQWNVLSEDYSPDGAAIGATVGGIIGTYAIPIPVVGTAIGSLIGSIIGSAFGDRDYPRAGYNVSVVNGAFVNRFAYELHKGNTGLASQMSNNAKELLNYFSVLVGGKVLSSELIAYGHLEGEYIYYPISRSPGYFGGSSGRGRVGFGNAQSAIVEGIIYQLTTTRFEGGDLYLKRALKNIQLHGNSRPVSVNTVDKLIDIFQVAQEYGIYKDNPYLYEKTIQHYIDNGIDTEKVNNWNRIKAQAQGLNLDVKQASDTYISGNVSKIVRNNGTNVNDVLIASNGSRLSGGNGDDIYVYSRGKGIITIFDSGGLDTIEFDASVKDKSDLLVEQQDNNLVIAIKDPNNPSAIASQLSDKIIIENFWNQKIERIRLGNNQEYAIEDMKPSFEIDGVFVRLPKPSGLTQRFWGNKNNSELLIGDFNGDGLDDIVNLQSDGNNWSSLSRGEKIGNQLWKREVFYRTISNIKDLNNTYTYNLNDNNLTINDIGTYQGVTRDGGIDTLQFGENITPENLTLTRQNNDIIVWKEELYPHAPCEDTFCIRPAIYSYNKKIITIKNGFNLENQIEIFRFADGSEYTPLLTTTNTVTLQPLLGKSEYSPDNTQLSPNFTLSPYKLTVVDITGDGIRLIPANDSLTQYDIDNDSYPEKIGWVAPTDGFLVRDVNKDGYITTLNEFFSLTPQDNVTHLATLDSNGDTLITADDTHFHDLRIWRDANLNATVELGELTALWRYGINSLSTLPQAKDYTVAGNKITASAYLTRVGVETRTTAKLHDVQFAHNPNGVKLESLGNGFAQFNYENKRNILFAEQDSENLTLTIDAEQVYSVTGSKGNDILTILDKNNLGVVKNGGDRNDILIGGDGNDVITGGEGSDRIFANGGDDIITIDGWDNLAHIDGGDGTDVLIIEGDDPVSLSLSDLNVEIVTGNDQNNFFTYDGTSPIVMEGGKGNDTMRGGSNDDILNGGDGDDILRGGGGRNTLTGGDGADIFEILTSNHPDIITDFDVTEDKIQLQGKPEDYYLGSLSENLSQGTGIFSNNDQLIGILTGVFDVSLEQSAFSFV